MQRICVYCGSSPGASPAYRTAAEGLGRLLAERGLGLVYGGARVGLMGAVADAALQAGAEVIGVIPQALQDKEVAHEGLTELQVVGSMHERKLAMMDAADAFVALPGGSGTLEELFETFTWLQLGLHAKPIGLLDVDGYYEQLVAFLDHAVAQRFMKPEHAEMLLVDDEAAQLLARFEAWTPPSTGKWLDRSEA